MLLAYMRLESDCTLPWGSHLHSLESFSIICGPLSGEQTGQWAQVPSGFLGWCFPLPFLFGLFIYFVGILFGWFVLHEWNIIILIFIHLAIHVTWYPKDPSIFSHSARFHLFYDWVVFHCIYYILSYIYIYAYITSIISLFIHHFLST